MLLIAVTRNVTIVDSLILYRLVDVVRWVVDASRSANVSHLLGGTERSYLHIKKPVSLTSAMEQSSIAVLSRNGCQYQFPPRSTSPSLHVCVCMHVYTCVYVCVCVHHSVISLLWAGVPCKSRFSPSFHLLSLNKNAARMIENAQRSLTNDYLASR